MKEVMKLALDALRLCTNAGMIPMYLEANQTAIKALEEALAQSRSDVKQEQSSDSEHLGEPVGEVSRLSVGGDVDWFSFVPEVGTLLYTTPQLKQLTDEEIKDVANSCMWWVREQDILDDAIEFARAIEAKLRSKNEY
jgi:hypothetical protein